MNCLDCVHYRVCILEDSFNYEICKYFTNTHNTFVTFDFQTFTDILNYLENTRKHLMKIKKSLNRDRAEFNLDALEQYLINRGNK